MTSEAIRWGRRAVLLSLAASVAGCGVPRAGPNKREIYAGSVQKEGDAFIVAVNRSVTQHTSGTPILGFSQAFLHAGRLPSDTVNSGDVLSLRVWENVDDGLLASEGQAFSILEEVQVDDQGFIFVPYAGRIRAAGNSPERIRQIITTRLDAQTPDPQVVVARAAGNGSTVSVVGAVGAQGVYPIERPTRQLSGMLAAAGGIAVEPEIAQVTVQRGNHQCKVWFEDIFTDPRLDIALRAGDKIYVEEDTRAFSVLGATGTQNRVPFESQTLSAVEAIAQVGGLNSSIADPTGVFIFRTEPAEVARKILGRSDLSGEQRFVYVLDLTEPNGLFEARDFTIRDDDLIYVTEAPYTQFQKIIGAVTGTLNPLNALNTLAQSN